MTWDTILSTAKSYMGLSNTSKDALLLVIFNSFVQKNLARFHDWSCLLTNTTGTTPESSDLISWPSGYRSTRVFRLTGDEARVLTRFTPEDESIGYPDPDEVGTGTPDYYADYGPTVGYRFLPVPDSAYTWRLDYYKWPTDMDTGLTPDLTNMNDLLIYLLCMHATMSFGLLESAKVYRQMIFSNYPPGTRGKYGLLKQTVLEDMRRPDALYVKEPFMPSTKEGKPPNYWSRPLLDT